MPRFSGPNEALDYIINNPNDTKSRDWLLSNVPNLKSLYAIYQSQQAYERGEIDAQGLLQGYAQNSSGFVHMNPETEKWLDNEIARENTYQQQNYEISARDTSLLSSGEQLKQLGLSPSSVIQVGGASAGVQGSTADTSMRSNSALRQQAKINDYNQKMGLAKSLIGAAGQMASSGIYGAAIGAVKNSASKIAGAAAHSGLEALSSMRPEVFNQMMKDEAWRYNQSHNENLR